MNAMRALRSTAAAFGLLFLLLVGAVHVSAQFADPRVADCGGTHPDNRVREAFTLERARDFWSHFPSANRFAPELNVDTPVFVVVFDGPTKVTVVTSNGLAEATFSKVVCVLKPPSEMYPDGEPLVYVDVPLHDFIR